MRATKFFTLVELLIVIAVISVLMSLLLPSLSLAKQSAMRIYCAGNLKQLGAQVQMYMNDNNGRIFGTNMGPGNNMWHQSANGTFALEYLGLQYIGALGSTKYTGSVLDCPSKKYGYGGLHINALKYMLNATLSMSTYEWAGNLSRLKYPSRTVVMGEIIDFSEEPNQHVFMRWMANFSPSAGNRTFEWNTHLRSDNFLYYDGHVSSQKRADQLNKSVFVFDTTME